MAIWRQMLDKNSALIAWPTDSVITRIVDSYVSLQKLKDRQFIRQFKTRELEEFDIGRFYPKE